MFPAYMSVSSVVLLHSIGAELKTVADMEGAELVSITYRRPEAL